MAEGKPVDMLDQRAADGAFLNLISKWLRAAILEEDGRGVHPQTGNGESGEDLLESAGELFDAVWFAERGGKAELVAALDGWIVSVAAGDNRLDGRVEFFEFLEDEQSAGFTGRTEVKDDGREWLLDLLGVLEQLEDFIGGARQGDVEADFGEHGREEFTELKVLFQHEQSFGGFG